jgi:hypothetical protein
VINTEARELVLSGFDRGQRNFWECFTPIVEKAAKYFLKTEYKGCRLNLKIGKYSVATPMSQQDLGYVIEFLNVLPISFSKLVAKCQEYGVVLKYAVSLPQELTCIGLRRERCFNSRVSQQRWLSACTSRSEVQLWLGLHSDAKFETSRTRLHRSISWYP